MILIVLDAPLGGGVVTQKNLKFGTGFSCYFGFPGLQPH